MSDARTAPADTERMAAAPEWGGTVPFQRSAAGLLTVAVAIVITMLALVVLVIVAIPLGLLTLLVTGLTRWVRGLRAPNGPLDGRRNVRVVVRRV